MAISGTARTTQQVAPNADASFLAASVTVDRYLKHIRCVNTTASAASISLGVGATLVAGGAGAIEFGRSIPANSSIDIFFGGDGLRVVNTNIRSFASVATAINVICNYVEVLL